MSTEHATSAVVVDILDGPHYTQAQGGERWDHYRYELRLSFGGRTMDVPWRQGIGVTHDPDIASVMAALLMDAQGVESASGFPDWAESVGLNPDSIRDRESYGGAVAQTNALETLLSRRLMVRLMDDEDATSGAGARWDQAWAAAVGAIGAER